MRIMIQQNDLVYIIIKGNSNVDCSGACIVHKSPIPLAMHVKQFHVQMSKIQEQHFK